MIKGLRRFLEDNLSPLDFIKTIIPGEIKVGKTKGENLVIRYKYSTVAGAKLIARSGTSVQEVFVVTSDPGTLRELMELM